MRAFNGGSWYYILVSGNTRTPSKRIMGGIPCLFPLDALSSVLRDGGGVSKNDKPITDE